MEKTIAAISTANGVGGLGVIRIAGSESKEIADRIFRSVSGKRLTQMKPYTATYGKIYDGEELIDEGVALVFCAPHSFTGEDVVEISCHGGMFVTKKVLRCILKNGASPAEPGEFTKRAFLNGKMGLTEAEAVMDIISARGEQSARAAALTMEGSLHKRIDRVKQRLTTLAAHLAAWADYPEEDIPQVEETELRKSLCECRDELMKLLDSYDAGKVMREGVNTVIAGKPNAGKSTLMNLLSGCERSIVTNVPGTTRDIIEETVMLGDIPLNLSDTAGIHDTNDPVELIGVQRAKDRLKKAGLVLAVFDSSQELSEDDRELTELLGTTPSIAIINKTDLPQKLDVEYIKSKTKHIVYISALSGEGLQSLENEVAELVGTASLDPSEGILSSERQYSAANSALGAVNEAIDAIELGITLDAVTVSIEGAIGYLCELVGESVNETVVNSVFHSFCVGK